MSRSATWTNNDGLVVGFGAHTSQNINMGSIRTQGNVEIVSAMLSWDDLPTAAATAATSKDQFIPAGSSIIRATLTVLEAFTSGGATTLSLGLKEKDGTDIDADGIDATIAKTVIDAIGDVVQCDGALVAGLLISDTADAYISSVVATGPYTAGMAELNIEYIRPLPTSDATDPITTIVGSL